MELLFRILGFDVPADTSPHSLDLQFRGPLAWWVVVVVALVICAFVGFLYATERGKKSWLLLLRPVMAFCRAAALIFLLLIICRPALQAEFKGQRAREIILLLDNTQSMMQQDRRLRDPDQLRVAIAQGLLEPDGAVAGPNAPTKVPAGTHKDPSRKKLVEEVLNNSKLHLLDDLQKHGSVVPLLLGHDARNALTDFTPITKRTVTARDVLARYDAEQSQTALADAIGALLQRKDADLPAAIVVMTDGRDNASKYTLTEVAEECARLKVPLHIYGVGSADGGNLKLRELAVQETLFADDNITVPVQWRADGIDSGSVVVTVTVAGKEQRKEFPVHSGQEQSTEFKFTLPKVSDKVLKDTVTAKVQLRDNDSFTDEQEKPVQIVDGKVKVLYIEYAPRKEYHFLSTTMFRDRRLEPSVWLISADPDALKAKEFVREFPTKKDLAKYDLVILGDVPADKLRKPQCEALADFVKNGRGGLVVIAGRQHMPAAYVNSPDFAPMLPVEFTAQKFPVDGPGNPLAFQPQLTPVAMRTEWMALADKPEDSLKQWKDLPGFFWHYPATKLRPSAVPLLTHPTAKMGDEPMPVLAMHHYGKGQVLFAAFEETWRWRFNTQDKVFGRFWSQLLLHMALPHKLGGSARQVELAVNRSALVLGKPGMVFARLLDRNFEPYKAAKVEGTLEYLDAKPGQQREYKLVLEPVPGREKEGEFKAPLPNHLPGKWQVRLVEPEPTTFAFTVALPPRHELEDAPMAAEALRTAASVSGGRFYQEESLRELAGAIQPRETSFTVRQEVLMWGPLPFVIFTGLVALEWLLRKFANLS
jgi:hypothetical protein